MKKITTIVLVITMLISTSSVFAAKTVSQSITDEPEVYVKNGQEFVDVDGEEYQYVSIEDFVPVENMNIVKQLDEKYPQDKAVARGVIDRKYLPVPPTYSQNLTNGSYSGSVKLNGDKWSPLVKRAAKRYTNFKVDAITNKTISLSMFYYDALNKKWVGKAFTDWKFNIIVDMRQFNFGGMGASAQGIRILFFDFDNSTRSFKYTLTDTNSPLNN